MRATDTIILRKMTNLNLVFTNGTVNLLQQKLGKGLGVSR